MVRGCLLLLLLAIAMTLPVGDAAWGIEQVTFTRDGESSTVEGRVTVEARDGGLLLESPNGALWTVRGSEITERTADSRPFRSLSQDEMAADLMGELPPGFDVHRTTHYLVCYNTSREYAKWCGSLLERLYRAFTNYWRSQGFELHEPSGPLVALVFSDARSYAAYGRAELGDATQNVIGYYSLRTNRVSMFDLTGSEALRVVGRRRNSSAEINYLLSQPEAIPLVSTVVHEATHQIAFNCGLHTRYADIPLWLSEGLAVYFETPDLSSKRGWRGIGSVNWARLERFRAGLSARSSGAIASLVATNDRLRDPRTAVAGYAEAWALNYFLIRQRPKEFNAYLKMLAEKKPLVQSSREERLAEFKQFFGNDLQQLDADFLRYMRKVR